MSPDEMRAEAAALESTATAYLARAKQLRSVAAAVEGLRDSPLTSDLTYDTSNSMTSSALAGPSRGPVPDGDGPATKVMRELGYANLAELAKALGERHGTVRSWNMRPGGLPDRVLPAVQKLRARKRAK